MTNACAAHVVLLRRCAVEDITLAELERLEADWRGARRARGWLFTAAALLSVAWWPRLRDAGWLPAHAVDLALALWFTVLVMAVVCRAHEWRLGRRFDRLGLRQPG